MSPRETIESSSGFGSRYARRPVVTLDRAEADALWQEVSSTLARERGVAAWLRERPTVTRAAIAAGAMLCTFGLLANLVPAMGRQPRFEFPVMTGFGLVLLTAAFALGLWQAQRPLPVKRAPFWLTPATLLLCVGVPLFASVMPEKVFGEMSAGHGSAAKCFGAGFVWMLPVFAVLMLLDRREPGAPWRAMIGGAWAGVGAYLALAMHCLDMSIEHLLLGHASVPVTYVALSALVMLNARRRR